MKRLFIAAFALFIGLAATAQEKKNLTLEESVLGQFRQFYPDQLQLQWIPGTDRYSQVKNDTLFSQAAMGKSKPTVELTLDQVNKAFLEIGVEKATTMPRWEWISSNELHANANASSVKNKTVEVIFNLSNKMATPANAYDSDSENVDFHNKGNVAFTKANNLFVKIGTEEKQVTFNVEGIVSGQSISRNEYGIAKGTFWSKEGNRLAFYQKDETNVTQYPLINYNTTPASVKNIRYPMAGDPSEKISVGVYDVKSGKTVFLQLNNGIQNDTYYATNLSWSPDENFILIAEMNRGTTTCNLNVYNALTGEFVRTLFTETDTRWVEPDQAPYFLSSTTFLWYTWKNGFHNYYLYDLTGNLTAQTNANFELLSILGVSDDKKMIFFEGTGTNATERHLYSAPTSTLKLTTLTNEAGTHACKVSSTGKFFIDQFSCLTVANRVSISSCAKGPSNLLLKSEDKLKNYKVGTTEIFTINANNGTPLYCRLIKPSNFDPEKKYPVVVYVYNGPHVQLITNSYLGGSSLWMNYLAEQGYLVFTVDGQGSAHRGKEFEQVIHRQLGTQEMADQLAGVEWLKKQSYVDPARMAVHGWSFGGFMTTSLMLRAPGMFKVGVAGGPVIDWRLYEVMYTERYMDTPQENAEGFDANNCTKHVDKLQGKLLMIHGADDNVVVLQHNMRFLKACVDKKVPVDFFVYPGHEHNVRGKDRVHLMNKIITYITDNL
jgi:dipeptidyl-peptidase-4